MRNPDLIETFDVKTQLDKYPIYIGKQLLTKELLFTYVNKKKILIVTDDNVAKLYLSELESLLSQFNVKHFIFAAGEINKSLSSWTALLDTMILADLNRDSVLIALGGGVVGDLTGFAASCFHRGISFIQIPTTLLSQVDSSVGGKTAINFSGEKNVLGAFYQPQAVFIDIKMLGTLEPREFLAGLAEVVKYALLGDKDFFCWLVKNIKQILNQDSPTLQYMIKHCCQMKAKIVEQDETEQDIRALLNLGHTFAHALESITNYKRFLHGEAVAIGIYCQALLSKEIGWLQQNDVEQIITFFKVCGLSYKLPSDLDLNNIMKLMYRDKKVQNSQLRFVLLKAIGNAQITTINDQALLLRVLQNSQSI